MRGTTGKASYKGESGLRQKAREKRRPIPGATGERHTRTQMFKKRIRSVPTQILMRANRKRKIDFLHSLLAPPIWIGFSANMSPVDGRLVSRLKGEDFYLGPDQDLYAVSVGAFGSLLNVIVEDVVDEGRFTDDGSGAETAVSRGGSASERKPPPTSAGRDRFADHR